MVNSVRNFVKALVTFGIPQRGNKFPNHKESKDKRKKKKRNLFKMTKRQNLEAHMVKSGKFFFSL